MTYLGNILCTLLASIYCGVALSQPISTVECPDTSGSDLILISDPYDCSRFYMCGPNGRPMHMSCPDGLYFNSKLDVCDFPDNVQCGPIPTEIISTTKTTDTPHYNMTTTYSPNYNKTTTTFPQHNITTEGPHNNLTTAGPQHNITTEGHHNNMTTTGPQYNLTAISTSSIALNPSTHQVFNATSHSPSQTVSVKSRKISAYPECPSTLGFDLVIFPDPHDCGSYYMCTTEGSPIHKTCPADLYFNPILLVCDYPENVNCIADNLTTSPSPPHNVTTTENSTYQPSYNATSLSTVNASTFVPINNTSSPAPEITTALPLSNTTTSDN